MRAGTDEPAKPSGVVTFLFTDIEGSTRRWEADAHAMRAALDEHDEILCQAITGCGGVLFKHTGDGVCAAFTSPRAAVDAAVAAQRSLELPVRMGIATGEAVQRGTDYFGPVLNRAARVMAAGHGGQLLLDGPTTTPLIGVDLIDLGSRRLRDLTQPVAIHQVRAPGLRRDFPPLRTVDPKPGNLRRPTGTLFGRDDEIRQLEVALAQHRLVTITGVGGVGKTRLAVEVGVVLATHFLDGVWLVELASVGDPAAVPDAVAAVLGVTQQPDQTMTASIAAALEGKSRLLILDNCEHVLDAAAELIDAMLAGSSTVRILATSREGVRVADEQVRTLPSLDTTANSAAALLFADRAAAVAPGTSLTHPEDEVAIAEICRRLDGIPLAIELAASRMVSMTASEVRDRLDDRFRLLVGSRRGLERHQTLRHAVQWSYDLLDDSEGELLQRCSVFAGGFDLAAACAVSRGEDDFATMDLLEALVRKSLLVADRTSTSTRFTMLETIRQFAEEQLVRSGDAVTVRIAHARYFAGREEDVLELWDGPHQRETYEWFIVELPNLRIAFRWAADHHDLHTAASIAVLATSLGFRAEQYEAIGWAEELIEPARAAAHPRLAQLYVMAAQCHVTGRIDDFLRYGAAGQAAIESGQFDEVRDEFDSIGTGYIAAAEPVRCIEWCRTVIARGSGRRDYARSSLALGLTLAGRNDEAHAIAAELLTAADRTDNPNLQCFALLGYGWATRDADPGAAEQAHRRGLEAATKSGNKQLLSHHAVHLARLAAANGATSDAIDYIAMATQNLYDSGTYTLLSMPLAVLATILDRQGRYDDAAAIATSASNAMTLMVFPELTQAVDNLRKVLGAERFDARARAASAMSTAELTTYALDAIDVARAELRRATHSSSRLL